MPRVSNQLLLFTYVSPFCLFKIASSPLTHRSPPKSVESQVQAQPGEAKAAHPVLPFCPRHPLTCKREPFLPQGWRGFIR